ncbi:hypothetical protein Hypma_014549 [Hypsizygus marmoreus]|uniref:F-box domain-containing protein n=1 Tax=Hypsizygus marmoreus TaxID=39966 RepID=A0A369JJ02_HYPMA|nr:hypothetical protein Hypma_014549 [Hypsizygus marmoreus]
MLELNPSFLPFDTSGFTNVTVFSNAPRLRRIFLYDNNDPDSTFKPGALSQLHEFQLPWGQLMAITLQDAWTTPAACYVILSRCPNLSESELWVSFTEPEIPFNTASHLTTHNSLIHHRLRYISFRFDFPATGSSFPDGFLRPLAFPSLQHLTIKTELCPHHTIERSILSLIQRSKCKLEWFSFSHEKDEYEDDFVIHLDLYPVLISLPPTLHSLILYSWPITRNTLDLMVQRWLAKEPPDLQEPNGSFLVNSSFNNDDYALIPFNRNMSRSNTIWRMEKSRRMLRGAGRPEKRGTRQTPTCILAVRYAALTALTRHVISPTASDLI